jgi:nucleotide-binding universal stress UspA family protein
MAKGKGTSKQVVTLVADDLSAGAELCLRRVALLPGFAGRVVEILNVLPPGHTAHRGTEATEAVRAALQRRARRSLGAGRRVEGTTVSTTAIEGEPYVEIIRRGRLLEAELIVMGAHARKRWSNAVVGTTTDRVIRKGDIPVLVVKRPPRGPYRRAVAAIDASDSAIRVLELAASLLPSEGAKLTALSSFTVPFETEIAGGVRQVIARTRRELAEERRRACEEIIAAEQGAHARSPGLEVVHGEPRAAVLRWVARERADLLVVGTHARSGVAHALLGSTAEALIRAAPCDVAVTRPTRFTFELP